MRAACWVLGMSLSVGCGGPAEPDRTAPQSYQGKGFSATLRKDVLSNAISPEPGVTLYDFHIGSQPVLFAYVGDKPGYPRFAGAPQAEEDMKLASGLDAHCRIMKAPHGRSRECLIALSDSSPKKLHAFYDALDPEWANVADALIQSFAPRQP